jgi:hypothetical protein
VCVTCKLGKYTGKRGRIQAGGGKGESEEVGESCTHRYEVKEVKRTELEDSRNMEKRGERKCKTKHTKRLGKDE